VLGRNPVDFQRPVIFHANEAVPTAPSGLKVTPDASGNIAAISWTDESTTEYQFRVERKRAGQTTWAAIGTTLANATTFTDTTFNNVRCVYRVVAVGGKGEGVSSEFQAGTGAMLFTPTGASAQLWSGPATGASFQLNWQDASYGEVGYQVQVCSGTAAQCTATAVVNAAAYPGAAALVNNWYTVPTANVLYTGPATDTGAASASVSGLAVTPARPNYYFRVAALDLPTAATPISAYSNVTPAVNLTAVPAAPTSVTATAGTAGSGQAVLSWVDNAINNASYSVQQSVTAGVAAITLSNPGRLYTVVPTITISAPAAGGVQATAHLVATPLTYAANRTTVTGGGVLSVVIDNPGTGYVTRPTFTLAGGTLLTGMPRGSVTSTAATAGTNITSNLTTVSATGVVTATPTVWAPTWTTSTVTAAALGNASGATVTGLTAGRAYQFRVSAVDIVGTGTPPASPYVNNSNGLILAR
jgi:hypothetical protein